MIQYLLSAIILVILDGIYLNLTKNYFNKQIRAIQGKNIEFNFIAAAITYILLIFGLNYFIIQKHRSIKDAALLGLIIYGVFELTNLALFKNWSILTVIIDTTWGTLLFGLTTAIVYKVMGIF